MPRSTNPLCGCSLGLGHQLKWLSWTRSRARKSPTCLPQKVWMAFTLMRCESGYTFRAGEICRLVLHTFINKRTLTTTKLSAKSPHATAPALLSGHPSWIGITSPRKRLTRSRQQFSYMHPKIERKWRNRSGSCSLETWEFFRSWRHRNCELRSSVSVRDGDPVAKQDAKHLDGLGYHHWDCRRHLRCGHRQCRASPSPATTQQPGRQLRLGRSRRPRGQRCADGH